MVLNVVKFHEEAARLRKDATRRSPEGAVADISSLVFRFRNLESKAKKELCEVILRLDLATQHARQLGKIICDPALKKHFDDELLMIEELLQLARDKTLKL